jgi:uncharacterized OB-fold protein
LKELAMSEERSVVREGLLATDDPTPGNTVALRASRCAACSLVAFPARTHCEGCGKEAEPIDLSTRATLSAHTEVIHPPPDAKVEVPYGVGLATFPEGVSIMGLLDDELRQTAKIGAAIETFAYEAYPGTVTYGYRLAAA